MTQLKIGEGKDYQFMDNIFPILF